MTRLISAYHGDTAKFSQLVSGVVQKMAPAENNLINLIGSERLMRRFIATLLTPRWLFDYLTYYVGSARTMLEKLQAIHPAVKRAEGPRWGNRENDFQRKRRQSVMRQASES